MNMAEYLKQLKEKKTVVSVYFNSSDWSEYIVGYIDAVTDELVKVKKLTKFAELAGCQWLKLDDISKVESSGKYETKLEKLIGCNYTESKNIEISETKNLFHSLLKEASKKKLLISVQCGDMDECLTGLVKRVFSESVFMKLFDQFGQPDGDSFFMINEISNIEYDSKDIRSIEFLIDKNKSH